MLAQSRGIVQVLCILKTQTQNVQNMVKTGQSAQNVPVSALITHVECQFWYGQEFWGIRRTMNEASWVRQVEASWGK